MRAAKGKTQMWATGWWKGSSSGFTLLELLIVTTILAVFWSATGLRIHRASGDGDLGLAGRRLAGEVRELRGQAAASHREHVLHLDLEAGRYWGEARADGEFSTPVHGMPGKGSEAPEGAGAIPPGVSVAEVAVWGRGLVTRGRAEIRFRGNGCVEHAYIRLRNLGKRSLTLEIHPVTGRVEVHEGRGDGQTG